MPSSSRKLAGRDARLPVTNQTHSARVGIIPRRLLWPGLAKEVNETARCLNAATASERLRRLECSPALRPLLGDAPDGTLIARRWPAPPLVPGLDHQKICVIDRQTAFIVGLDLDDRRYDDTRHQRLRNETWQDVQLMCSGVVATDG